jgi:5'-nucleotidase
MRRRASGWAVVAVALTIAPALAACGDDDGGGDSAAGTTTTAGPEPLDVLVTNDDGVRAEGIDTLVEALRGLPDLRITVVAPADQQSGTGGRATEGDVASRPGTTRSGYEATAVEGFPSDAVRVALDELGLEPDLVISGINEGQNLGPLVDVSGTIGAARAAVRAGVPALAVSQGLGSPLDYPTAADLVVDWLGDHRAALAAGEEAADSVVNLNVPTCPTGEVRGSVEVASATEGDALGTPDCTGAGTGEPGDDDDVEAFLDGYATFTEVAVEPATEPAA